MELKTTASIYSIPPQKIKVRTGLDRYRKDAGKLEDLAKSINENGQLQPIMITKDMELVDGGRRLAACLLLNRDINFIFREDIKEGEIDDFTLRSLEVESNLRRKAFTPAEEELAIADLHKLYTAKFGVAPQGRPTAEDSKKKSNGAKLSWSPADTAKLLGVSQATMSRSLQNAETISKNPELLKAKSKKQIANATKRAAAVHQATEEAKRRKEEATTAEKKYAIHQKDCIDFISSSMKHYDVVIADSPYGIGIDKIQLAGYSDERDAGLVFAEKLAAPLFRKTASGAHLFWFCAPEFFWDIRAIFMQAKWSVYVKPIIWIKWADGSCNNPEMWPASCYEMVLYARKQNSQLLRTMPDWVQQDPLPRSKKVHHSEKPVALIENLLVRCALPNMSLLDPFCGSGAITEAGLNYNMIVDACELDPDSALVAESRVAKAVERRTKT